MSAKTKVRYDNGTSFLHISNAQRDDIGHFRCIADNRVANPVSLDALLIVKCKFLLIIYVYIYSCIIQLMYVKRNRDLVDDHNQFYS